eukprot:356444-Chlamydomonas_euryale.AAC.1
MRQARPVCSSHTACGKPGRFAAATRHVASPPHAAAIAPSFGLHGPSSRLAPLRCGMHGPSLPRSLQLKDMALSRPQSTSCVPPPTFPDLKPGLL